MSRVRSCAAAADGKARLRLLLVGTLVWLFACVPGAAGSAPIFSETKLLMTDRMADDHFGEAVAISGGTVVVAAGHDDRGSPDVGSVSVYVERDAGWTLQQQVKAPDGKSGDTFGISVAIDGDTLVVGASGDDVDGVANLGSAYVFVRSGSRWSLQQKLVPTGAPERSSFGTSVAVDGDSIAVASHSHVPPFIRVYVRSGTVWSLEQSLSPACCGHELFPVALAADTLVAGGGSVSPTLQVFERSAGTWRFLQYLEPQGFPSGHKLNAISGSTILIGAPADDRLGPNTGSAYAFVQGLDGQFTQQQEIVPSDARSDSFFGGSVAVSEDTAIIGAAGSRGQTSAGGAYIFRRNIGTWLEEAKLTPSDGQLFDFFGSSAATNGVTLLVGADGDDLKAGAAYLYAPTCSDCTRPPSSLKVTKGTLIAGGPAELVADDDAYVQVDAVNGTRFSAAWTARFDRVPKSITALRLTYSGKNTGECRQRISIRNQAAASWEILDDRVVGATEVLISDLTPTGPPSDYVSGTGEAGTVITKVSCSTSTGDFVANGDLLELAYSSSG